MPLPIPKEFLEDVIMLSYGTSARPIPFRTLPMTADGGYIVPDKSAKAILEAREKGKILWADGSTT